MSDNSVASVSPLDKVYARSVQDPEFRQRLIKNPRATLESEMGLIFPEAMNINVVENTHTEYTIALPVAQELNDEELDAVSGGINYCYHIPEHNFAVDTKIGGATADNKRGFGNNPYRRT